MTLTANSFDSLHTRLCGSEAELTKVAGRVMATLFHSVFDHRALNSLLSKVFEKLLASSTSSRCQLAYLDVLKTFITESDSPALNFTV